MKTKIATLGSLSLLGLFILSTSCKNDIRHESKSDQEDSKVNLVDPFIGTSGDGHTYPGATLPFGMVQLSPDNGTDGWSWVSGYHYSDSLIAGFSHTHLSGTGIGDLLDISVMPTYPSTIWEKQPFSHQEEYATPGYYSVKLKSGIKAELTTSKRVGMHKYHFNPDSTALVSIDLGFHINWDKPTDTFLKVVDERTIVGYRFSTGWAKNQKVYFVLKSSESFKVKNEHHDDISNGEELRGNGVKLALNFGKNKDSVVLKVAISSASTDGAEANLNEEIPHWDFDKVSKSALSVWENELNKIDASFISPEIDTVFYTALYHSSLAPSLFSDVDGFYKSVEGKPLKAEGFDKYTVFSLWDTFRAAHPLFTILHGDKNVDFVESLLGFYSETGLLPVWELAGNETNTMTGYHAVPVIADAILKGIWDRDLDLAYEAMVASASQSIRGTDYYREYGYIPFDKYGWSVTKTLEYAFDDWCIAQVAIKLGKDEDAEEYLKRAGYYKNLFDKKTRFMRAKDSNGKWINEFDPFYSEHGFEGAYIEGTAWQHMWFVPHDVQGLVDLFGSKKAFLTHLDSTFNVSSEIKGENASLDITGLIGQYAHGNEPSHHISYLYNYAGEPWKAQSRVREILTSLYTTGPDGLPGNEDCGQMSAWYVFSSLGFYPVNPSEGIYVFGSPLVKNASLNLPKGKTFNISTENNHLNNKYISRVLLNGKELKRTFITHEEIMSGGDLHFVMDDQPNLEWADYQVPLSMSFKK